MIKTKQQIEIEFRNDFKELLKKYNATIKGEQFGGMFSQKEYYIDIAETNDSKGININIETL